MARQILLSGHRGTKIHAIENTRAAFDYCITNKIDYIEFDVKRTADNQIVVFHDSYINRLLNGNGNIEKFSLEQLRALQFKDGQKIQTLKEFFEQVQKHIRPMLEIKSFGIAPAVIDLVHQFKYRQNEILIQSFHGSEIATCYALDPLYDYGLCIAHLGKFPIFQQQIARKMYKKLVAPYPVKWLNLDGPFIYDAFIDEAVKNGSHIILGAMQTEHYLKKIERWHVEIVNANDPTEIRAKITSMGYLTNN